MTKLNAKFSQLFIITMLCILTFSMVLLYLFSGTTKLVLSSSAEPSTNIYSNSGSGSATEIFKHDIVAKSNVNVNVNDSGGKVRVRDSQQISDIISESNLKLGESFLYRKSKYVLELSNTTHGELIDSAVNSVPTIVVYYAHWCPHCKHFVPTYEGIVQAVKESGIDLSGVSYTALNCVHFREVCSSYKIKGYPTIRAFNFQEISKPNVRDRDNSQGEKSKKNKKVKGDTIDITNAKANVVKYITDRRASLSSSKYSSSISKSGNISSSSLGNKMLASSSDSSGYANIVAVDAFIESTRNAKSKFSSPADRLNDALTSLNFMIGEENAGHMTVDKLDAVLSLLFATKALLPHLDMALPYENLYNQLSGLKEKLSRMRFMNAESAAAFLNSEYSDIVGRFESSNKLEMRVCGKTTTTTTTINTGDSPSSKASRGDGYTCGLWLLFHYLTVAGAFQSEVLASQVLFAIRTSVDHLFGCADCRSHFLKSFDSCEYGNCKVQTGSAGAKEFDRAAVWLWRMHNGVTERILGETIERNNAQSHFEEKVNAAKVEVLWPRITNSNSNSNNDIEVISLLKKNYFDEKSWSPLEVKFPPKEVKSGSKSAASTSANRGLAEEKMEVEMQVEVEGTYPDGQITTDNYGIFASQVVSKSSMYILYVVVLVSIFQTILFSISMISSYITVNPTKHKHDL